FTVLVDGEHQYGKMRDKVLQLPDAFRAQHAGEVDVHQHNVRAVGRNAVQGGLAIGIGGLTMETRRTVEHGGQVSAQMRVVFDQGNLNRFVHSSLVHTSLIVPLTIPHSG